MLLSRRIPSPTPAAALALLSLMLLTGCGESDKAAVPEMPRLENSPAGAGRSVWMGTCRNCHLTGVGGAPAVTSAAEWERRLAKGKEQLLQSVLQGVNAPDGSVRMPPRGGNAQLTDEQVKAALEYKLAAIEALRSGKTP
jgi:cytochrome c5